MKPSETEMLLPEPAPLGGAKLHRVGLGLLLGTLYFAAARLGLGIVSETEQVAVFWPAAGIAAGTMLAIGPAAFGPAGLAVLLATVAANLTAGKPPALAVLFGLFNALESLIIAGALTRFYGPRFSLDHIGKVLAFTAATALGCATSAALASTALVTLASPAAGWLSIWSTWFESDAIGVVTVAPLVMCIPWLLANPLPRTTAVEGTLILGGLAIAGTWVYVQPIRSGALPITAPAVIIFPLLLWLAARTPPVFAAAASFVISVIASFTMARGIGRFGDPGIPLDERVLAAQLSMFTATFCALALSALFEERRRAERQLKERELQLYRAMEMGRLMAFEWAQDGERITRIQIAGSGGLGGPQAAGQVDQDAYLGAIHPDDRPRVVETLAALTPAQPSYTIIYRYRPEGEREVWLEETGTVDFDPAGRRKRLAGLARDVTERVHADERQVRLIDELNHRVKNVLTLISAVVERSRERHTTVDDYVAALRGRVGAMTRTHTRLSRSGWSGVALAEIVDDELAPYRSSGNVVVDGPPIALKPEAAQAMTLVLHELATNAAKYGALASSAAGNIDVSWELDGPEHRPETFTFLWREHVPTLIEPPRAEGYGTSMIRNLLRHELGGEVELTYLPTGVTCRIRVPVDRIGDTTH